MGGLEAGAAFAGLGGTDMELIRSSWRLFRTWKVHYRAKLGAFHHSIAVSVAVEVGLNSARHHLERQKSRNMR